MKTKQIYQSKTHIKIIQKKISKDKSFFVLKLIFNDKFN